MTIDLHDPLVEKLLATVQGYSAREVRRASERFVALVDMYAPRHPLYESADPFSITIATSD
jgi:hypothetical protein